MSTFDCSYFLGDWQGFEVEKVLRVDAVSGIRPQVWIRLRPQRGDIPLCSVCGQMVPHVHEYVERRIRDLPIFEFKVLLFVKIRRIACSTCGKVIERIPWLERYSRHTKRLAASVASMCKFATIKDTAEYYDLDRKTVKAIDKEYLIEHLPTMDLSGLEIIAMDEFAIEKGHQYATVVIDPRRKQVLWIGRGRTRESVHPFFELLGEENCRKIKAVAMDMNASFEQEVWEHCPNAKIVYDLFHVVAKYGREVIDRVRVDEANRLRNDKKARQVVKGSRWLLLKNQENLTREKDRIRLKELLEANKQLALVYVLKADLKQLWQFTNPWDARRFWKEWLAKAYDSEIRPLILFAKRLKPYIAGVISHCKYRLHTSILEGINNKIKVIKRRAYGYRFCKMFCVNGILVKSYP